MFRIMYKVVAIGWLVLATSLAFEGVSFAGGELATYASVGAETSVPYGWVDFCQRYRGECQDDDREPQNVSLTPAALKKIERVNAWVNRNIQPVTDMQHWGVVDQWDYPTDGKGDCEDYALLKRKMLIEEGFPRQALLMTVVKDKNNEGHAILSVKTDRGDYVLDNLSDAVKPWNVTAYRYVKRQSQLNQNAWVTIGPPTSAPLYVSK
jgi:predicted transglutaminase-like cysteine proteinase